MAEIFRKAPNESSGSSNSEGSKPVSKKQSQPDSPNTIKRRRSEKVAKTPEDISPFHDLPALNQPNQSNAIKKQKPRGGRPRKQSASFEKCALGLKCSEPHGKDINWVMCDNCENWYHVRCVGITNEQAENEDFICRACAAKANNSEPEYAPTSGDFERRLQPENERSSSVSSSVSSIFGPTNSNVNSQSSASQCSIPCFDPEPYSVASSSSFFTTQVGSSSSGAVGSFNDRHPAISSKTFQSGSSLPITDDTRIAAELLHALASRGSSSSVNT